MYGFICDLEAEVEGAFYHETDESNPFLKVLSDCEDCDDYCMITMFDETGMSYDVEIDSASDLMAMLVSVRLLSANLLRRKPVLRVSWIKGGKVKNECCRHFKTEQYGTVIKIS